MRMIMRSTVVTRCWKHGSLWRRCIAKADEGLLQARSLSSQGQIPPNGKAANEDSVRLLKWIDPPIGETQMGSNTASLVRTSTLFDGTVAKITLNRPERRNAFNMRLWEELELAFGAVEASKTVRAVILDAEGPMFTAGMDLHVFSAIKSALDEETCEGRKREIVQRLIDRWQSICSLPANCKVPVIACIHGACIGAGVDLITACDIRLCDSSAEFCVKEVDLAIVADVGTLQRLPKLIGEQHAKEMAYTGRSVPGDEAKRLGMVLDCLVDSKELNKRAEGIAHRIAKKSPLTIRGIKKTVNYALEHRTDDALHQIRLWNAGHLFSDDLTVALESALLRTEPEFRRT